MKLPQMINQKESKTLSLCTTYEAHDPVLLNGVLPFVEYLEVTPDTIAQKKDGNKQIHPDILNDLKGVSSSIKIVAHGVGLSIGSYEGYSEEYLSLLDELNQEIELSWHSEHLGYTKVNGEQLNTMLTVPRTKESINMLIPRIKQLQARYNLPFLLENIAELIPNYKPEYSEAAFLNILTQETGCGLILDIYNIECDAYNFGFDIHAFLRELNLKSVKEIHLAGGVQHNGFQLDIHSRTVADSTITLTQKVLEKEHQIEIITYEILPQAVKTFGQQMVIDELGRLSNQFEIKK